MAKKICTKAEAVRLAYFHAGMSTERQKETGVTYASFESETSGKWRTTTYFLEGKGWEIYATREKHIFDHRIRDAYQTVTGELDFALWYIETAPENDVDRKGMLDRLSDPANLIFSLEGEHAKREAKRTLKGVDALTVSKVREIIDGARVMQVLKQTVQA